MSQDSHAVDVTSLPPADLNKLRQSLSEDVQLITNNFGNLKVAQSRYAQALEALGDFVPENAGKEIMVPLTGSLYVPGSIDSINSVMVDIGTGYYVSKAIPDARLFINDKLKMIQENLEKVGQALSGKRRDLEAVTQILQSKMAQIQQQRDQELTKLDKIIE
jgi:prefoldin alpha subunit